MNNILIKKNEAYCHFTHYWEDCPLLNIAFYLINNKIITKNEEIDFIESFSHYFSKPSFYRLEFLTYYTSNTKDIHFENKKEFQIDYIQQSFYKLKQIKNEFKELTRITKQYATEINQITNIEFQDYFDFETTKQRYINQNYGSSIYHFPGEEKELILNEFDNGFIINNAEIKIRNQFLTKAMKAWYEILTDEGVPIQTESLDSMSTYGAQDVYALFSNKGKTVGFYSKKDDSITDIQNAKTFPSLHEAKKYVNFKKINQVAYVKLHLNFLSIEETLGQVDTSHLASIYAIKEKQRFDSIKTKQQLAQDLLALCTEHDQEVKEVLEKMLNQESLKKENKKMKV
jgi:hypothetical protein